ncbi:MAG: hypothetical protein M1827_005833 [Pycnora praestabilis]|nr:MAG: hypothetical protein M1827_005833 [Pycnora praestabilis]
MRTVITRPPSNRLPGAACLQVLSRPHPRTRAQSIGLQNINRIQNCHLSDTLTSKKDQRNAIDGYYSLLLEKPLNETTPATRTDPEHTPVSDLPKTDKEERLAKARVVFGSRLAGPVERRAELNQKSTNIAGVMVPPRPGEPDNCCMSGCVNCVWDRFRDELEEWAVKSTEARTALQAQRDKGQVTGLMGMGEDMPTHTAISMDDDGGGSETNWGTGLGAGTDLFRDIPVGIKEFMRTEKKLKAKHKTRGSVGD